MLEDVCPQNIALRWHAEASSAVYATPLITDLFSDGRKDVVVPSFLHNLEVGAGAVLLSHAAISARRRNPRSPALPQLWRLATCRVHSNGSTLPAPHGAGLSAAHPKGPPRLPPSTVRCLRAGTAPRCPTSRPLMPPQRTPRR